MGEESLHLIYRVYHEVREEGYDIHMPKVGVMVEVPAAVYQIRELAERVDFLSVGSNDLTQYLLAVDRNNPRVAGLYNSYHPAVLGALYDVVQKANQNQVPVTICGEIAGEPAGALLLMGMGYRRLSMNGFNLRKINWLIRKVTLDECKQLLSLALTSVIH